MQHPRLLNALLWITVFSIFGCSFAKVDISRRPSGARPEDYRARFDDWTRKIRVIPLDGLENILTADATYLSYLFKEAYVERFAYDLRSSPGDKARLRQAEMTGLDKGHEFFVTAMSAVKNCDKLDPEDGPWTIRLKNDRGAEVAPVSVEEIDKIKPFHVKYFFFNPAFRKAYRLTFPLTDENGEPIISEDTRFFELFFATAYGRGTARWEIKGR